MDSSFPLFFLATLCAAALFQKRDVRRQTTIFGRRADKICETLEEGGPNSLHIIMDFDRTMTMYWDNPARDKRGLSTHGILEKGRSDIMKAKADALNLYYYPLETSSHLTTQQKIPFMVEWYRAINELLVESNLSRADISTAVARSCVQLRPGVIDTIMWCNRFRVPLVIMSAGIGDVLAEVLEHKWGSPLPDILHIVSNGMLFDENGRLEGFTEPLIHMFNKSSSVIPPGALANELHARRNCIVVGDSPGDSTMGDGIAHSSVLKVGLVNDNINNLIPIYRNLFDVLLLDDCGLDMLKDLLHSIQHGGGTARANSKEDDVEIS
jgi:HAD superfamily hydrolase (TIGR01544 family)